MMIMASNLTENNIIIHDIETVKLLWYQSQNLNHALAFSILIMRHWNSQVLWNCCTDSNTWNLDVESMGVASGQKYPHPLFKVCLQCPLQTMNTNLNHALAFSIIIMRQWNSQAAMKLLCWPKHSQSWCWKYGTSGYFLAVLLGAVLVGHTDSIKYLVWYMVDKW